MAAGRRDTVGAGPLAAPIAAPDDPDAGLAGSPSDHLIREGEAFRAAIRTAAEAVAGKGIAVIGVTPTEPATGYGYIKPAVKGTPGAVKVLRFVEKPDEDTAKAFLDLGYLWNSGNFLFRADVFLTELARFEPEIAAEDIPLDILYEDAAVFVIDKPAGLVVHPGAGNPAGTLVNALLHRDPALEKLPRAGIVHRLDKDTKGLLVVACLFYTSDAAAERSSVEDQRSSVDLGGRRIIKKKKETITTSRCQQ